MRMQEALEILKKKYPKEYVVAKMEKAYHSTNRDVTDISVYVASIGWRQGFTNFQDAINSLDALPQEDEDDGNDIL